MQFTGSFVPPDAKLRYWPHSNSPVAQRQWSVATIATVRVYSRVGKWCHISKPELEYINYFAPGVNQFPNFMIEPQTLRFLSQLKENNNKPWFDAHRAQYEAAKIDFSNFIQFVIEAVQKWDTTITGLTSKDCLFRINRDVRFSKDKTPYKAHFGASIKRGSKKSPFAGYYFHLEPGGKSFIGGGMWMPEAPALKNMRQEIDYNWEQFKSIITTKDFKKVYTDLYKGNDQRLSSMPKGYEKDNPAIDYLKLKSFFGETRVADEELTKATLHKKTVSAFQTLYPFICFINRTVAE
jgi:uncharacterized protein (TIGR02453 family)